ncbi:MAG: glycosyltransferase family 4 protein [Solirubrobacteraceae bacterium]
MTSEATGLRVLHILGSNAFAGTERHALHLVMELRELGCAAELVCRPSAASLRTEARASRVPVHPVVRGAGIRRPAIVHVHDGRSAILGLLLARTARALFVRTQHFVRPASVEREGWRRSSSVMLHRSLNRRLDGYIAVSQAVADAARKRRDTDGVPTAVIPPGIRLAADHVVAMSRAGREQSRFPIVTSVGRLEAERRFDVLIEAIPRVLRAVPDCRFVIAGSGSAEADLKRRARELGAADAVTWTGWLPEIAPVLRESHVYVNTWPWEGFGMATAEAMGFALPVIAASSGASIELVKDGVTGRLVPPEDPVALAVTICELVRDLPQAAAMGAAGRARAVSAYSVRQTAVSTLAFYQRLPRLTQRP